jgi:hypothetical protein
MDVSDFYGKPAKVPPSQVDGGHWYKRDGSPCYEVPKKDGGLRPVNLQWDRKLNLVPSVTTVTKIIDKPALTNWMVEQGIMAALTLPRIGGETEAEWMQRIREDSRAQAKAAAEEGSRIHDACERHYRGLSVPAQYKPHVAGVAAVIAAEFPGVTDWVAEASFAHESGYGGKVDLHSPSTGIVIDYKGKDGDFSDGKKLAYDQHWQLGAYQTGLLLPNADCANVFFSRTHPGAVKLHRWKAAEIAEGAAVFGRALELWKLLKRYDPSFIASALAA